MMILKHSDRIRELGGPGSGNFGHAGRPGERGGSQKGSGGGDSKGKSEMMNAGSPGWNSSKFRIIAGEAIDENAFFRASSIDGHRWANYDINGNLSSMGESATGLYSNIPTEDELKQWGDKASVIAKNAKSSGADVSSPMYIRYGRIPKDGKSKNYASGDFEKGTSAYRGVYNPENNSFKIGDDSGLSGGALALEFGGKIPYLISGDEIGTGSDGEPVLKNAKTIGILKRGKDGELRIKK